MSKATATSPRAHGPLYEWVEPGEIVRVDVKKLSAVPEGGSRVRGSRKAERQVHSGLAPCFHVAVDDRSWFSYVELYDDERAATCASFVSRNCQQRDGN